jgi:mannan endo-1,4-beta-mannosidase
MKTLLVTFIFLLIYCNQNIVAQTPSATVEAESGVRAGAVTIATSIAGYSGTGYITNFTTAADKITVTMNVPSAGLYKLVIRYQSQIKTQYLFVNGSGPSSIVFPNTTSWADVEAGKYFLNPGANTFTIQSYWGYINIDKFSLYTAAKNNYDITPNLVNPNADAATKSLYAFMVSKFNVRIITGQTDGYYDTIKKISGKSPMLRDFDFQHYTQGYSYLWKNGGFSFGWDDNGQTQKAIDWYNSTGKTGIVAFQWHWHSPSGGTVGTNTFSVGNTTFDASKAGTSGTQENTDAIRDIDSIASQLKKLQAAGVPVLFRPLHEASGSGATDGSGAWFWWGAKGATVCKKLFNIIYDRLTNYHGLNNLIWIWSSSETAWYPGNDSIDIVGYDSYPGAYSYVPQKSSFDILYNLVNGKKLIAMSENGPIPDPNDCLAADAPWSYFMSWDNLVKSQNTDLHINSVFNNSNVITLENPTSVQYISNDKEFSLYHVYPNPANTIVHINGPGFIRLELVDMNGSIVYKINKPDETIRVQNFNNGIYVLKIYHDSLVDQVKLMIWK